MPTVNEVVVALGCVAEDLMSIAKDASAESIDISVYAADNEWYVELVTTAGETLTFTRRVTADA